MYACDPALFRVLSGNTCICGTRFGTKYLSYYDNLDPECAGIIIINKKLVIIPVILVMDQNIISV